jgi:hypothetical protein
MLPVDLMGISEIPMVDKRQSGQRQESVTASLVDNDDILDNFSDQIDRDL